MHYSGNKRLKICFVIRNIIYMLRRPTSIKIMKGEMANGEKCGRRED